VKELERNEILLKNDAQYQLACERQQERASKRARTTPP
jgi:hypothetical protein